MPTVFITGIDTDAGKSVATGLLARWLCTAGYSVITQKIAQTGCEKYSEDILLHRKLMGIAPTDEDREALSCPYLFSIPASPHLAAAREQQRIDPEVISRAAETLEKRYEYLIIEGVGGLYVPLNESLTVLDYLTRKRYPVILVSSAKLGSINHTLLSLEALSRRKLKVLGILYNEFPPEDPLIAEDSQQIFKRFLKEFGYQDRLISIPRIDFDGAALPHVDFSNFFI